MPGSCRRGLRPGLAGLFESLSAGRAAVLSCSVLAVQRHAGRAWPCWRWRPCSLARWRPETQRRRVNISPQSRLAAWRASGSGPGACRSLKRTPK